MPIDDARVERRTFFGDPALDDDLPAVNEAFWSALITHIERDGIQTVNSVLDVGCHTGGLLLKIARRFHPALLVGIEPLAAARSVAELRLAGAAEVVTLLVPAQWPRVQQGSCDLITSHETLYLEPDLGAFMTRIRVSLAKSGVAYVVLGCHTENPLWPQWKLPIIGEGHQVYDYAPLDIMAAATGVGLLPSVQPLRRAGWVTYDPVQAVFPYPDIKTMFDHHYRHKLIFRLRIADDETSATGD